jgi:hypothetical protein
VKLKLLRLAAAALTSDSGKKAVGWILVAAFSPLILIVAFLCALGSGEAEHNTNMVYACFYGVELSKDTPRVLRSHVNEMRTAFSLLDSAIYAVNAQMENGDSLDSVRVKAVFLALCFGENAPTARAANRFVDCFYTWEEAIRIVEVEDEDGEITEEEESYAVARPLSTSAAYSRVAALLGREITDDDRDNIAHIYRLIVGDMGDLRYDGWYSYIGGPFDPAWHLPAAATDPTKTAEGLVAYVVNAYETGWGYVWGTFGNVLTEGAFTSKLEQYPEAVGNYADFIRANWIGRRTADCVGLIKSYGWFDPDTGNIVYGSHGMPDVGADQMYYAAAESGTIDTIPEIPGLAVWQSGHIGVYIGNGEVIEAMGTMYGVVKTRLEGSSWTHWLKVPYIYYN